MLKICKWTNIDTLCLLNMTKSIFVVVKCSYLIFCQDNITLHNYSPCPVSRDHCARAHLPNRVMASRHSTGFTYSLAWNSCLNTSMRVKCAICGRGAEFPQASSWRCLTFPHGAYSAHWHSSRSFFPLWPMYDPQLANSKLRLHGKLPTRLDFISWLFCPKCSPLHCARYEFFIELCNIFVYCRANYSFSSSDSCFEFITFRARWSLNSAIFYYRANYFHPDANNVTGIEILKNNQSRK